MKAVLLFVFVFCSVYVDAQLITTIAGKTRGGSIAEGIPATDASIGFPSYIVLDDSGNYYFGSNLFKIRKISTYGIITTIVGNGTSGFSGDGGQATAAEISLPGCMAFDKAGNLFIPDISNNRIRRVDKVTGIITTYAGDGVAGFGGDGGQANIAHLFQPWAIAFDRKGNLFFADAGNYRIRKIDTNGIITTVAGMGASGTSGDGGPATSAQLAGLERVFIDKFDNLYVAQTNAVRKINLATGIITRAAGSGLGGYSGDGGPATAASLLAAVDVIADNSGNFYISEEYNNTIRKVNTSNVIITIAGNNTPGYSGDGNPATSAQLNYPRGIAMDACNNLIIMDAQNHVIRKITYNLPPCTYLGEATITGEQMINIYPNPANNELNVENLKQNAAYKLYDFVGREVKSGWLSVNDNTVSIRDLTPGMYVLQLTGNEGQKTIKRFVRE